MNRRQFLSRVAMAPSAALAVTTLRLPQSRFPPGTAADLFRLDQILAEAEPAGARDACAEWLETLQPNVTFSLRYRPADGA